MKHLHQLGLLAVAAALVGCTTVDPIPPQAVWFENAPHTASQDRKGQPAAPTDQSKKAVKKATD